MNDQLTFQLTPTMMSLIPVVAAIIQIAKNVPAIARVSAWLPYISVGVSLGLCYAVKVPDPILPSIIIGLAASGGYEFMKAKSNTT